MANASTTGFGFRPIKMVGQAYNNAAMSEYSVAASSALISHACLVQLTADGVVLASGNGGANNLGTLNGVFYTDATSNKPTFSNFTKFPEEVGRLLLKNDSMAQIHEKK